MKLTSKGQLTIPKKFRQKFGLSTRSEIEIVQMGNTLCIIKKKDEMGPADRVFGLLKKGGSTDALIKRLRGQ